MSEPAMNTIALKSHLVLVSLLASAAIATGCSPTEEEEPTAAESNLEHSLLGNALERANMRPCASARDTRFIAADISIPGNGEDDLRQKTLGNPTLRDLLGRSLPWKELESPADFRVNVKERSIAGLKGALPGVSLYDATVVMPFEVRFEAGGKGTLISRADLSAVEREKAAQRSEGTPKPSEEPITWAVGAGGTTIELTFKSSEKVTYKFSGVDHEDSANYRFASPNSKPGKVPVALHALPESSHPTVKSEFGFTLDAKGKLIECANGAERKPGNGGGSSSGGSSSGGSSSGGSSSGGAASCIPRGGRCSATSLPCCGESASNPLCGAASGVCK
jgi:uncharacterized membrane protein YgcG